MNNKKEIKRISYKSNLPEDEADLFLQQEEEYVENGMRICMEAYLIRLENHLKLDMKILSKEDIVMIFATYRLVYDFNCKLLKSLKEIRRIGKKKLLEELGSCILTYVPIFTVYQDYNSKINIIITSLSKKLKENILFRDFCKISDECFGKTLDYYLKLPVRRLPQYLISLAKIYELIKDKSEDYANSLGTTVYEIKKITDKITKTIKINDMKRLVTEINDSLFSGALKNIMIQKRYVIRHERLIRMTFKDKVEQKKEFEVILFSDLILWANKKHSFSYKKSIFGVIPTYGMKVKEYRNKNIKYKYTFELIGKVTSKENHNKIIFFAENKIKYNKWRNGLKEAIFSESHTLHPTNPIDLILRIQGKKTSKEGVNEIITITDKKEVQRINKYIDSLCKSDRFKKVVKKDVKSKRDVVKEDKFGIEEDLKKEKEKSKEEVEKVNDENILLPPPPPIEIAMDKKGFIRHSIGCEHDLKYKKDESKSRNYSVHLRDDMLKGIKKGVTLKKLDRQKMELSKKESEHDIMDLLTTSLNNYRKFVEVDDYVEDEEFESDWD